jgi:uncharacterized membrane protein SpoIIM required for sporulation
MATSVVRHRDGRFENLFFSSMAVLILVMVFLGFAHTYYLAAVFEADALRYLRTEAIRLAICALDAIPVRKNAIAHRT